MVAVGRCRSENFILGGYFLQISLEAFILVGCMLLGGFKGCQFSLQVLDMSFLPLAKSSLPANGKGLLVFLISHGNYKTPKYKGEEEDVLLVTYAARFWAFLRDCAGVKSSSSLPPRN